MCACLYGRVGGMRVFFMRLAAHVSLFIWILSGFYLVSVWLPRPWPLVLGTEGDRSCLVVHGVHDSQGLQAVAQVADDAAADLEALFNGDP